MRNQVWILEQHEDTRLLILETLTQAGIVGVGFARAEALVRLAVDWDGTPLGTVVDAMTATGHETSIRATAGTSLIVLTTWPTQTERWMRLGVSRFLVKPFDFGELPDLLGGHQDALSATPAARMVAAMRTAS